MKEEIIEFIKIKDGIIDTIEKHSKKYVSEASKLMEILPMAAINRTVAILDKARSRNNRVFIFGNGGSAATALHFATDLSKGAICESRPRMKAIALTDNVSMITAWANDTCYDNIFAEQLKNLLSPADIALGISGSGNSQNVLNAMKVASDMGAFRIGLTGFNGGKLKNNVDISLIVPSNNMEQIEDMHLLIGHMITAGLRTMHQYSKDREYIHEYVRR